MVQSTNRSGGEDFLSNNQVDKVVVTNQEWLGRKEVGEPLKWKADGCARCH